MTKPPTDEIPDWLAALRPDDEPSPSPADPVVKPPVTAKLAPSPAANPPAAPPPISPVAAPPAAPPAKARPVKASPVEPPSASSLLAEEDLPAWLRQLSGPTIAPSNSSLPSSTPTTNSWLPSSTPPPTPSPPSSPPTVPAWLASTSAAEPEAREIVAAPDNAPPVWAPRESVPTAEPSSGAAIFHLLQEQHGARASIEAETPTEVDEQRTVPWWLYLLAVGVLLVVVVVIVVTLTMR